MITRLLIWFAFFTAGLSSQGFGQDLGAGLDQPLTISLSEFRTVARQKLEAEYGPLTGEGSIVFQDGFDITDSGQKVLDKARLFYSIPIKPISDIDPNLQATYYISPTGISGLGLSHYDTRFNQVFVAYPDFMVTYKEGTDVSAKAKALSAAQPGVNVTEISLLSALLVQRKELDSKGRDLAFAAFVTVSADPDVVSWEFNSLAIKPDEAYGVAQNLGSGLDDQTVDVNKLRDAMQEIKIPIDLTTVPAWPEPFGKGPITNP